MQFASGIYIYFGSVSLVKFPNKRRLFSRYLLNTMLGDVVVVYFEARSRISSPSFEPWFFCAGQTHGNGECIVIGFVIVRFPFMWCMY